jgi:hypothetical protein
MIARFARRALTHPNSVAFATAAEIAEKTLAKFQKRYADQTDAFGRRMYNRKIFR